MLPYNTVNYKDAVFSLKHHHSHLFEKVIVTQDKNLFMFVSSLSYQTGGGLWCRKLELGISILVELGTKVGIKALCLTEST